MTSAAVPEIDARGVPDDAVLLDVREDDEWEAGHVPGAAHLSMMTIADRLDDVPDGSPVYVICRTGGRSARVTAYLNANGWDAVNVADGMFGWAGAGRQVVADHGGAPEIL